MLSSSTKPSLDRRQASSATMFWVCAVLFFLLFSYLIPKACDDWYFTARYLHRADAGGLLGAIWNEYNVLNGRLLGNGLSVLLAGSKLLRVLFKTGVFCLLLYCMGRLSGMRRRGGFGWAVAFVAMMLVPIELLKQTYAWDSGFINYAVSTALLLVYLCLLLPAVDATPVKDGAGRTILSLLIGFSATLFVENVALLALALGVAALVWHCVRCKKLSLCTLAFLLGALIGTAILFSSPTRVNVLEGGDYYRRIPTNLMELLVRVKANYQALSMYSLAGQPLLLSLLSVSSLLLLRFGAPANERMRRLKTPLAVCLTVAPVYFFFIGYGFDYLTQQSAVYLALCRTFGSPYPLMLLDLLLYGLYLLSVVAALLFFTEEKRTRILGLTCLCAAMVVDWPMLFVWPIDFRCFLPGYLCSMIAALLLFDEALHALSVAPKKEARALRICAFAIAALLCICDVSLYASCPKIEKTRAQYIEQQMRVHASVIVLPSYDCEAFLQYPDTLSFLDEVYYYDTPGDLELPFIPYADWVEEFSHGLSPEDLQNPAA